MGDSVVSRNRKHLFVLDHQNEKPRSSSASLGFGRSTSYNLINPVHCAFNFKSPVDLSTELDHANTALLVTPTLVTAMPFRFLTLRWVVEMVRSRTRLRVGLSLGSQTTLCKKSPGWKGWISLPLILENLPYGEEEAPMNYSEKPAKNSESEENVHTRSGRQVKPVRKDGMCYYY